MKCSAKQKKAIVIMLLFSFIFVSTFLLFNPFLSNTNNLGLYKTNETDVFLLSFRLNRFNELHYELSNGETGNTSWSAVGRPDKDSSIVFKIKNSDYLMHIEKLGEKLVSSYDSNKTVYYKQK